MGGRHLTRAQGSASTRAILLSSAALAAAAAGLVLAGEPSLAGIPALLAGSGLVAGAYGARRRADPAVRVLDGVIDRLFDGAVLGAVAWDARAIAPASSAGALVAMGAGFLGSYVRARGTSLGYGVEESPLTRGLRCALISLGLLAGWLSWTVWAAAAVSLVASGVRMSQVAKEERA